MSVNDLVAKFTAHGEGGGGGDDGSMELEVRMRTSRYDFYFIKECLANHDELIYVHETLSNIEYYPENIRKVSLIKPVEKVFVEKKQGVAASVAVGVGMKLHLSLETPIIPPPPIIKKPAYVRNKVTTVYEFQTYIFELSVVNSKDYEIEIEYYHCCCHENSQDTGPCHTVGTDVSNAIKLLQSYLLLFQKITCNVNTSLRLSSPELSFDVNKPVNLKNNTSCSNHVATLKMDGVRMLLVIHPLKTFLYNHNTVLFFQGKQQQRSVAPESVSVLDVEYFTEFNECIAFDLCVYEGRDYRFKLFQDRYNTLLKISPVPVAKYYYDFSAIKIDTALCDGVIYTPLDRFYHNSTTYKWKPVHCLTVDLKAVDGVLLTNDNVQVGVDERSGGESSSIIGEYSPLASGGFKLVRTRPDKKYPNSYKVFQDVLRDISQPVIRPISIKKDKKVGLKDTMKPRQENKSCYFTFGGRIPYLVRTGLPQCHDEMEFYLAAFIVSEHRKYDRIAVLKTIRCDISREMFIETKKELPMLVISKLKDLYTEDQNVRVKFIFDNILKLDDALSTIQPHTSFSPREFVKDCMDHFDEKMGYSSQRYKIEILRKELEDCLERFLEKSIGEAYNNFINGLTPIEMDDLEMLGDGIHVISLEHEDMKTVCPSKTGKSIVLIEFDSPAFGDRTIELLGKFDDIIDYHFAADDTLFSFFNRSEEDTP